MRSFPVPVLVAIAVLASCSQDGASSVREPAPRETVVLSPDELPSSATADPASPDAEVTFAPARVLIDTDEGSVIVDAEKAETGQQRQQGLMFRESLEPDHGMVFLFFEERTGGFWMKNVTFPLSIAFFDAEGVIVAILDMEPCREEPCPSYEPVDEDGAQLSYLGALEVNQGKFEEWGVEVGDRITVTH